MVEGRSMALGLLFLVVLVFVVVVVMNLVRTIIRYFNYKITRQKGSLLLSFGLINTKSTILKPEKVQIVSMTQNYFQKKLNVLQLQIKQTAHSEREEKNTHIEIPGCNASEKDAMLHLLYQKNPEKGVMLSPNFRKLGFAVFLTIVLPLVGYFFFRQYQNPEPMFDLAALIYTIFVGLVQYFKYRNHRLFVHDHFIIKQSGAWDITHEIIEPGKIQGITISQLFWHKSIGIGSLILHTAGGNIRLDLGQMKLIQPYVNKWLHELEKTDVNWM
jgi:putative membrane protein